MQTRLTVAFTCCQGYVIGRPKVDNGNSRIITAGGLAWLKASANMTIWKSGWAKSRSFTVPTITLEGDANGTPHPDASSYASEFSGRYEHRVIRGGIGHNLPQEAPEAFAKAIVDVGGY